eukprot:scpid97232/ scgid17304/ 
MLYFTNSFFIVASLFLLMPDVAFGDWSGSVCTCIGVENPHINKGAFRTTTPDSISGDIKAGLLTRDRHSVAKPFSSNRLDMWLHADIGANTLQEAGSDITDLDLAGSSQVALLENVPYLFLGSHRLSMVGATGQCGVFARSPLSAARTTRPITMHTPTFGEALPYQSSC